MFIRRIKEIVEVLVNSLLDFNPRRWNKKIKKRFARYFREIVPHGSNFLRQTLSRMLFLRPRQSCRWCLFKKTYSKLMFGNIQKKNEKRWKIDKCVYQIFLFFKLWANFGLNWFFFMKIGVWWKTYSVLWTNRSKIALTFFHLYVTKKYVQGHLGIFKCSKIWNSNIYLRKFWKIQPKRSSFSATLSLTTFRSVVVLRYSKTNRRRNFKNIEHSCKLPQFSENINNWDTTV